MGNETHDFKAEVSALLRLVTNSLYTHSEIFLRELVSNAADALDKARFQALVSEDLRGKELAASIRITADKQAGTLTLEDTGIGMTRDEAARNLGTIAHSGTLQYLQEAQKKADGGKPDLNLIGQFGVGFYSAFMVADEVVVDSLSGQPDAEPVRWTSRGEGAFTLDVSDRTERGTSITLKIKEDSREFLEPHRIQGIVRRYSNYVMHPIHLVSVDDEGTREAREDPINSARAIWSRRASELEDADYSEFYKHVMGGFLLPGDEPLARLHFSAEAPIQFDALLYVPGRAPADLFMEDRKSLQLYARRVLVIENTDKLLPAYLRFFRGVVDSEDLPLNVSREMLQEHKSLQAIRRQLTRKALKLLSQQAADDAENYLKIWKEFGAVLKEGLHSDGGNRDDLLALTRWLHTSSEDGFTSLADYVAAMPEGQDLIYYIAGDDERALRNSPHLEAVRSKGYDVLLMTDPVDEWVLQGLTDFEGKSFRSVTQGSIDQDADEAADDDPALVPLLTVAREQLGDRVRDVRGSKRLTESASCLVDEAGGLSRNMERILRMARRDPAEAGMRATPRILELNPDHGFVKKAAALASEKPTDPRLATWIDLLCDMAALSDGALDDPAAAVKRIQSILNEVSGA